jgi:hypothetical protein
MQNSLFVPSQESERLYISLEQQIINYQLNADAGIIYQEKTEFVQYAKKMKLAMNFIIYFHMIILITKENCTLKERLVIYIFISHNPK